MTTDTRGGPQFVQMFSPVLETLKELGGSARPEEVRNHIIDRESITDEQLEQQTPGGVPRFHSHVAWARFYLSKDGLIDSSRRGVWSLTDKGRAIGALDQDDALALFKRVHQRFVRDHKSKIVKSEKTSVDVQADSADEAPDSSTLGHRQELADILRQLPPEGFERFCQRILRESGFEQVSVTGRSGDGGIDGIGILQVNALVSFKVLFQCKRYSGRVGPNIVRDFRGAMMGRADKGIILTTGTFTAEAKKEAVRDGVPPIELVDYEKLVEMLEGLELGVRPVPAYEVDSDFFEQFGSSKDAT